MKKFYIILFLLLAPLICYGAALDDESGELIAVPGVRTLTFTNPARILTIINDGAAGLQLDFNGTVVPGAGKYQIKSGESQSWSFDIGGTSYGIKYLTYATSSGTATIRYHAVTK